jgi:hypothetical protein
MVYLTDFELSVMELIGKHQGGVSKGAIGGKGQVQYVAAAKRLVTKGMVCDGTRYGLTQKGRQYLASLADAQRY